MALILGTNSYISLANARVYVTDFALESFPTDDVEAEALLTRAARSLDRKYGNQYVGYKSSANAAMHWPRTVSLYYVESDGFFAMDSNGNPRDFSGYPSELGHAQVELACLISNGIDPFAQPEAVVTKASDKLDVIESSREYKSAYQADPLYTVKLILRPLLKSMIGGVALARGA